MKHLRLLHLSALSLIALTMALSPCSAAPVNLSISNPNQVGLPGQLFTFDGTITNNTGAALDSTDLTFNFSGFDPSNVTLTQLLGTTSFVIADGATSPLEQLFTFSLDPGAGAGTYPSDVVLETAALDTSDPQTVSVTVATPEPSAFSFIAIAALALLLWNLKARAKIIVSAVIGMGFLASVSQAQVSPVRFVTGAPGLGRSGSTLLVAMPMTNNGTADAANVQVTGVSMGSALLTMPTALPVAVGTVAKGHATTFQANFDVSALPANARVLLTVRGTYQVGSTKSGFSVNKFITVPAGSPGSGVMTLGTVASHYTSGAPYPAAPPDFGNDDNVPRPPIPTGPFVPGTPTPFSTGAVGAVASPGPGLKIRPFAAVTFAANDSIGTTSAGANCSPGVAPASCAEPSGATGGGVVFVTANWTAAYSTDGGSTFTQLNPTTIFPADAVGFCCDQVVQYVPSIDRFIWFLQGGGGVRLAAASPAQIISSSGTAWTYWNLTPSNYGQPAGTGFDYPDVSIGNNNLYTSWDVGFPTCPPGCNGGVEVTRIPLSQIGAGGTIFFDYTTPSDSSLAWGSHLTQDTGDEIFWAAHDGNSSLRIFSLAEGSGTYFWRDVTISSWPNSGLTSATPDGQDWLKFGFPGTSIVGATRSGNALWFAWTAGTNSSFSQPHVEMVSLDRSNNFNKTQQVQIWNNSYAFAYPALATDFCSGEVGLSLGYGGANDYENHVVGVWGDYTVYTTATSNLGVNRYGDFMTIRQDNSRAGFGLFDAFGYGVQSVPGGGMKTDVRFVTFGHTCSIG